MNSGVGTPCWRTNRARTSRHADSMCVRIAALAASMSRRTSASAISRWLLATVSESSTTVMRAMIMRSSVCVFRKMRCRCALPESSLISVCSARSVSMRSSCARVRARRTMSSTIARTRARSASPALRQASSIEVSSRLRRTSYRSSISCTLMVRTAKPWRGRATSTPWRSSRRAASRTGARLTPMRRAMSASTMRLPGARRPSTMARVSWASTRPTRSVASTDSKRTVSEEELKAMWLSRLVGAPGLILSSAAAPGRRRPR